MRHAALESTPCVFELEHGVLGLPYTVVEFSDGSVDVASGPVGKDHVPSNKIVNNRAFVAFRVRTPPEVPTYEKSTTPHPYHSLRLHTMVVCN